MPPSEDLAGIVIETMYVKVLTQVVLTKFSRSRKVIYHKYCYFLEKRAA